MIKRNSIDQKQLTPKRANNSMIKLLPILTALLLTSCIKTTITETDIGNMYEYETEELDLIGSWSGYVINESTLLESPETYASDITFFEDTSTTIHINRTIAPLVNGLGMKLLRLALGQLAIQF
jgi:hypothetical protein